MSTAVAVAFTGTAVAKGITPAEEGALSIGAKLQHGPNEGHLPPVRANMDLVSKLRLTERTDGIADVAEHSGYAYLNAWDGECTTNDPQTNRGGTHIVDIRDPHNPRKVGFVQAPPDSYHGEGAHVTRIDTPAFKGDVLAVNNETCSNARLASPPRQGAGGMDLIDVTDPANPRILVQDFGDRGGEGTLTGDAARAHSSHSVFLWQLGNKAYAVQVDNAELHDVDIFDITDPRNPQPVAEYDLEARFPLIREDPMPRGDSAFNHDMIVKVINGRAMMVVSYWDGGYVQVDATNPADITYVGDSDFGATDPLTGASPPEGNGHYGEFSFDNAYFLAADEDFDAYRLVPRITSGPNSGMEFAVGQATDEDARLQPGETLSGSTYFVGQGCDLASFPPAPAAGTIALIERGTCSFQQKTENADTRGYIGVIIFNNQRPDCQNLVNMAFTNYERDIPALFVNRRVGLILAKADPGSANPCTTASPSPPVEGESVEVSNFFDGWGYAHQYKVQSGKWPAVGHYAIDEGLDRRFAFGFGDLTIHEWATDPTEYLAYAAYYSGGLRTVKFGPSGIDELGVFIDDGGSNFWGVEQFTTGDGRRMIAGSDRDYGLYIVEYDGPGEATAPKCEDVTAIAQPGEEVRIPLACTDVNNNPLTLSIERQPANGTLSGLTGNAVTYRSSSGFNGADTFTYAAFDGAARSKPAQVTVLVGRCANRIEGTDAVDLINGTAAGDAIFAKGAGDTVLGAQGDDCLAGDDGNDQLTGADGDDSIGGGEGRDRMFGDAQEDDMRGGTGRDHVRGGSGNDRLFGESGGDYLDGGSNKDRISGGSGRDSIIGGAGRDRLFGGRGNDSIDAGKSANRVSGGSGDDRIVTVNGSRDVVRCGSGRDHVTADRRDRVRRDCERVSRTRRAR